MARATLSAEDQTTLGLGKEPRDTAGFIQASYTLFDNAGEVTALADFGYDADKLAAKRAKIEAYDQANQAQEMAKSAAQRVTQDQDAALAAMNDWVAQYLKITKVALRGKKQSAGEDRRGGAHDEDGGARVTRFRRFLPAGKRGWRTT